MIPDRARHPLVVGKKPRARRSGITALTRASDGWLAGQAGYSLVATFKRNRGETLYGEQKRNAEKGRGEGRGSSLRPLNRISRIQTVARDCNIPPRDIKVDRCFPSLRPPLSPSPRPVPSPPVKGSRRLIVARVAAHNVREGGTENRQDGEKRAGKGCITNCAQVYILFPLPVLSFPWRLHPERNEISR